MAPPRIQIDPKLLTRARALYETGTSLDVVGKLLGVSGPTVRTRAIELGWSRARPARDPVPEEAWPAAPPPMREPTDADAAPDAILARLGRLIAREMLRAETYDHSPEVAARTLVMLARSAGILCDVQTRMPLPEPMDDMPDWSRDGRASLPQDLVGLYLEVGEQEFMSRVAKQLPPGDMEGLLEAVREEAKVRGKGEAALF